MSLLSDTGLFFLRVLATAQKQRVDDQQSGSDRDRAVGDIERRKVRRTPVEVQEIDDVAVENAVDDVAGRSTEDQCETGNGMDAVFGLT